MQTVHSIKQLRRVIKSWQQAEETVGFVPTMGNLHQGHLSLAQEAKKCTDRVVVSVFVNPTQFGAGEDFASYPRTSLEDHRKLSNSQIDVLFLPENEELYFPNASTEITVSDLSDSHCGTTRNGHFSGVATIVCKLFNIVQPDKAFFGKKDFQQLLVIRRMVQDLNIPVTIEAVPTMRETDGLAMSSRNDYLTPEQKALAPKLFQALQNAQDAILIGNKKYTEIEQQQTDWLREFGFQPEYFSICRSDNLKPANISDTELVILTAAKIGTTRLIDNLDFIKA
jgi:pantoate--beta-alanine ligase